VLVIVGAGTPAKFSRVPGAAASVCSKLLFDPMMRTSSSATSTRWARLEFEVVAEEATERVDP
jgi:hypothetical protein